MAFCPGCGSQIADNATFCPSCGKAVGQASTAGAAAAPAPAASSGLTDNIAGLLCYLPILAIGLIASIIFLVTEPYKSNKFIRFHALQSLALMVATFVASIALWIVFLIVGAIVSATHSFGLVSAFGLISIAFWGLFCLALLILVVVLMIKAYGNQKMVLPFIGPWAEKQANAV